MRLRESVRLHLLGVIVQLGFPHMRFGLFAAQYEHGADVEDGLGRYKFAGKDSTACMMVSVSKSLNRRGRTISEVKSYDGGLTFWRFLDEHQALCTNHSNSCFYIPKCG
jgi:hypothetical protein